MDTHRAPVNSLFSFSLICLAAALAYFSYALIETIRQAPLVIEQFRVAAKDIDPVLASVDKVLEETNVVTELVPGIITEVQLIREQIAPILKESAALRQELPAILTEVEKVRTEVPLLVAEVARVRAQIPVIIAESKAYRNLIPIIVTESQGYRSLVPEVLAEMEATRNLIPPTIAKAEQLLTEARATGQQASEGAVTGFFTGILKAPFKMVTGASESVFGTFKGLSESDIDTMNDTTLAVINNGIVGNSKTWTDKRRAATGTVTLVKEHAIDGQLCRDVELIIRKNNAILENRQSTGCLNSKGQWEMRTK